MTLSTSMLRPGVVTVKLENHGNVNLAKLPMPSGAKQFAVSAESARFQVSIDVDATKAALSKLLATKGWHPYGEDKDVLYFKKNAVRLEIKLSPAAEEIKGTLIDIKPELLAHDLPTPPEANQL